METGGASAARLGLDANLFLAHSAISVSPRFGRPSDAYQLFDAMHLNRFVSKGRGGFQGVHRGGTVASILPAMGDDKPWDITFLRQETSV
jgi:hypothetical protein